MDDYVLPLAAITFGAAIVNGALGYGFSSITVPLALLFLANRVLNPALVLIEVVLNSWVLWVNRASLPVVWRRMLPIIIGLLPGVLLGTLLVSQVNPSGLKLITYLALLPLIFLQATGYRRQIKAEKTAGLVFGGGLGVLYSVTTISGPPLAVMLSNQGLTRRDFRAGLGLVRLAESSLTAVAYLYAGLHNETSLWLIPVMLPGILIGVPIGARLIRKVEPDTFRRICMSFDAWIVAFGLSRVLADMGIAPLPGAYLVMVPVTLLDSVLLYRFFSVPRPPAGDPSPPGPPVSGPG